MRYGLRKTAGTGWVVYKLSSNKVVATFQAHICSSDNLADAQDYIQGLVEDDNWHAMNR